MNDEAREALAVIVRDEQGIISETWRLQGLLMDRCPAYRPEINLLVAAAEEGVPDALQGSSDRGQREIVIERLIRQLQESRSLEYTRARWAVESWAQAMGLAARAAPPPPWPPRIPEPGPDPIIDAETERRHVPPPPPPNRGMKAVLIGGGAAIGVIALIAIAAVALSNNTGPLPPTTTPTSSTTTTTILAGGTGQVSDSVAILISRVHEKTQAGLPIRSTCHPLDEQNTRITFQGLHLPSIGCSPTGLPVAVGYYQLPTSVAMNKEYLSQVSGRNLQSASCDPTVNATFLGTHQYVSGATPRGYLLCYITDDSRAILEWTDDALNIYGEAQVPDSPANRQALYQYWRDDAGLVK